MLHCLLQPCCVEYSQPILHAPVHLLAVMMVAVMWGQLAMLCVTASINSELS
jgi:hypothetical protein